MSNFNIVFCLTTIFLVSCSVCNSQDSESKDIEIWNLIQQSLESANSIRIDGQKKDWRELVQLPDVRNERIRDRSRDIKRVSIAPTREHLYVMIETAKQPSREHLAFWLNIDVVGHKEFDVRLGLAIDGQHRLKIFDEDKSRIHREFESSAIEAFVKDVVEIKIPYSILTDQMSKPFTTDPTGTGFRPFVRVNAFTWDSKTKSMTDLGPSVASYYLLDGRYDLDSLAPGDKDKTAPISLRFPFNERQFVGNGAFGLRRHVGKYCYDFYVTDIQLEPARQPKSVRNDEYFSWDKPAFAPFKGRVTKIVSDYDDRPPLETANAPGNYVLIENDTGFAVNFYHLKKDGASVSVGSIVDVGRELGRVGNSGASGWPHIHLSMQRNGKPKEGLPIAFENVTVGLNPIEDDPWSRNVRSWIIRQGYFVDQGESPTGQ